MTVDIGPSLDRELNEPARQFAAIFDFRQIGPAWEVLKQPLNASASLGTWQAKGLAQDAAQPAAFHAVRELVRGLHDAAPKYQKSNGRRLKDFIQTKFT
jgi:hypothetical protein